MRIYGLKVVCKFMIIVAYNIITIVQCCYVVKYVTSQRCNEMKFKDASMNIAYFATTRAHTPVWRTKSCLNYKTNKINCIKFSNSDLQK